MSYAQDKRACTSWHREHGTRAFCNLSVAHYGDHSAVFMTSASDAGIGYKTVTWPNKQEGVWPDWLKETVQYGLMHIYDNPPSKLDREAIAMALQIVEDNR